MSILTNASAQVALSTLRNVTSNLNETQQRISTGLEVRSAKDNPAYFLVAQTVRGDLSVLEGLRDNLTVSVNAAKTASDGITNITDNINEIQKTLTTADTGTALDELQFSIKNSVGNIEGIINATNFNGVNLLSGSDIMSVTTTVVREDGNFTVSSFQLKSQNLNDISENASLDVLATTYQPDLISDFDKNGDGSVVFGNPGGAATADSGYFSREVAAALDANGDGAIALTASATTSGADDTDGTAGDGTLTISADAIAAGAVDELEALGVIFADRDSGIVDLTAASSLGAKTNGAILAEVETPTIGAGAAGDFFTIKADAELRQRLVDLGVDFVQADQATQAGDYWAIELAGNSNVTNPATGAAFTNEELMTRMVDASYLRGAADASGFSGVLRALQVNGSSGNVQAGLVLAETLIARVNVASSVLGTFERTLESRQNFLEGLTDSLEQGVASLVEADLDEESTRLQAQQVQQQLATQALTIANQAPQNVLSLFR